VWVWPNDPLSISEEPHFERALARGQGNSAPNLGGAGCLIFDDTVQEKAWTDGNEIICWHFDHCKGRSVKGINLLNALHHSGDVSIPVAFEVVAKPIQFSDVKTRKVKRASGMAKNKLMREMVVTCLGTPSSSVIC
jgi:hypothetical protein